MLKLIDLESNKNIEYKAFIDEENNFNLIADLKEEALQNFEFSGSGLIFLSKNYIKEIELLLLNPINKEKIKVNLEKKIINAIPKFNFEQNKSYIPRLITEKNSNKALLLLAKNPQIIKDIVFTKNAYFFINKEDYLSSIYIPDLIKDFESEKQMRWLKEQNLVKY